LDNAGERIVLVAADGAVIEDFTYDDGGAWPGRADGGGSSLERESITGDPNLDSTWGASTEFGGSPAAASLGPIDSIVVNEVLTHTDPPLVDAVELFNPTNASIDISGWYLSDGSQPSLPSDGVARYKRFRIPNGTVIPAGGYLLLDEQDFNPTPGVDPSFSLNSAEGDDVWLIQADQAGKLLNFIDHVEFGAAANGESFGRWPNGDGGLYPMVSRTLGAANSGPRIGPVIISEMMYNPQSANDDLEFVELANITDQPVDLTGWTFTAGFDFTFGATTLPARGTLLVLRFDPTNAANAAKLAAFRAAYPNLPQNALLVGGYAGLLDGGVLDNGGETVRLSRPDAPQPDNFIPYLLVDEVDYNDVAPWPTSPDGMGTSLSRASQTIFGNEPTNWSGQPATPGINNLAQTLTTITGTSGNDTYHVVRVGSQLHIYENTPPVGQPTYASELSALGASLTINSLGGDDSLTVDTGGQPSLGLAQLIFNAGAGENSLALSGGSARIDGTATGGTLNTTVAAGAQLSTNRLMQNGLTLEGNSRMTLLPVGGTSVVTSLNLASGATLDIGNNALVVDYSGTSPVATARQQIVSGRGLTGLGATWTGAGITSSAAAQANATEPESRSVGYAENSALPLGPYAMFRGQAVDATSVLIAYTRTADANLDGLVDDEDVTVLGASYAPGASNGVWALGDFEYNGFIDDDDVTLLGAFYNPSAGPLAAPIFVATVAASSPDPVVAWSPDHATLSTAGLPATDAIMEIFGQTNVQGQATRAQTAQDDAPTATGDDVLIDLLAAAVATSGESLAESRPAGSRDVRQVSGDLWALEWI
jgi:hypothetical protein